MSVIMITFWDSAVDLCNVKQGKATLPYLIVSEGVTTRIASVIPAPSPAMIDQQRHSKVMAQISLHFDQSSSIMSCMVIARPRSLIAYQGQLWLR